jgi:hypothetical protein
MAKKPGTFSDEIRQAVDTCGLTRYRICKDLGIPESLMSRFMAGAWLGVENMDALAKLLDLHITTGKRRTKKKG